MSRLRLPALVAGLLLAATIGGGCSFLGIGSSGSRQASVFHLRAGDCFNAPQPIQASISHLGVISCHRPHTLEVYALVADHAGSNYPGSTALQKFANAQCIQRFEPYVGIYYQYSQLFTTELLPSVRSWTDGDRTVVCVITTTGQHLTRSVKGSKL